MEKKINLLFGIIGGLLLVFLQLPIFPPITIIGGTARFIINNIIMLLSFIGMIIVIYFSILLIIDAIKTSHRK